MNYSRRNFIRQSIAGVAAAGALSTISTSPLNAAEAAGGNSAALLKKDTGLPEPATFDRLPMTWYKRQIGKLKDKMKEKEVDAIWLRDALNITYFTGYFFISTERPYSVLLPVNEDAIFWFHPDLDRDLVNSWWKTGAESYFDFLHAAGGFPDQGKVVQGETVDLFNWQLRGIRSRGFGDKTIAVDNEWTPSQMGKIQQVMPHATWKQIDDVCMDFRMVKTPEELALWQRAYDYFSKIHAFARDYILQHGTDATDYQVGHAATEYGVDLIMKDIKRDGRPHSAVGITVEVDCRTGNACAYPHPNQFFYNKIKKGDSLQVAGGVAIGGYGGELYRYYQILPSDPWRDQVWQVVTDTVQIMLDEGVAGRSCSNIAYRVHQHQVKHGVERLIYHRPGHGMGIEGHQPPWLALGDYTMLREGMTFSVEPGLYDAEKGFGYNPSDTLLICPDRGRLMSSVPVTKEWMYLKL
jgi:Xaa-Pro aminopeptidase